MYGKSLIIFVASAALAWAQSPELSFKADKPGEFTFDTGKFSGRLVFGEKAQGIVSLVDKATGVELAKGRPDYGIFSFYRLLSPDKRWGGVIWEWPKHATLLPDGAVRIDWPAVPADGHPAELSGIFRWSSPDTLDIEAVIKPQQDMPKLELFIGSYFKKDTQAYAYLAPTRYGSKKPEMLSIDVSPLTEGLYHAFPRDLQAAQYVYDGRWEQGLHPVQWTVARYMAGPLALRHDPKTKMTMLLMSRPNDCSAIYCSYNQDPPDNVAAHYSTYLSLLGRDVKAGETANATARLLVRKDLSADEAIEAYNQFVKDKR